MVNSVARFVAAFFLVLVTYLLLALGSGDTLGLWDRYELMIGVVVGLIGAFFTHRYLFRDDMRMLNPIRWVQLLVYLVYPFFWEMTKANIKVAIMVVTGRVDPGIVRIRPGYKTDLATTMLANSITLTPGTLSVDVDEETNDLFVHCIDVGGRRPGINEVAGSLPEWVRRIAE